MPCSAYQLSGLRMICSTVCSPASTGRQQDAVVVGVRLGAEDGDVVQVGRDLQQLFERAHAGHAVADHHQLPSCGRRFHVRLLAVQELQHRLARAQVARVVRHLQPVARARAPAAAARSAPRRWWPRGRWSSSRCGRTAAPLRRRRASPSSPCCRWPRRSSSARPAAGRGSARPARRRARPSAASWAPSPARGRCPHAASCRRDLAGRLSLACPGPPGPARPARAPSAAPCLRWRRTPAPPPGDVVRQVSQGSSEWFWNTTPRSGPGPDLAVVQQQHAGGGRGQPGHQVQQRALAAAAVADQRDELAACTSRLMSRSARRGRAWWRRSCRPR
jgi:hypothetical protein